MGSVVSYAKPVFEMTYTLNMITLLSVGQFGDP